MQNTPENEQISSAVIYHVRKLLVVALVALTDFAMTKQLCKATDRRKKYQRV